jgi:hypothetical protein
MLAVGNWGSSAWARERPLFLRVEKRGCLFSLPVCILEGNTGIYMAAGRKETNGSREVNNNAGSYAGTRTPFHPARETPSHLRHNATGWGLCNSADLATLGLDVFIDPGLW